ncbi:terpene synthase family protein [Streptacidiphilus cavernicola]|uniref:Terpene synthase n=1 Tax=Streptacidiphilus cavernicola TaxID=3342716 RepID=A0ABV6W0C7_9ACTN
MMSTTTEVERPPLPRDGLALTLVLPRGRLLAPGDHPDRESLRRRHDAWFRERMSGLGLDAERRLFEECEGVSLMCRVLPGADGERLLGICLAASVLFLLDDVTDGDSAETSHADRYLAVLGGASAEGGSAHLRLLGQTLARVREGVPDRLWARFTAGFAEVIATAAGKSAAPVHDYPGYLAVRRADAAFDLVGVAIEHGLGLDLAVGQDALAGLLDACFEHTVLVNDLLSYRKEYAADEPMNAVGVLRRTAGLDLQQAVDQLCARLAAAEDAYFSERERLLGTGAEGIGAYLDAWALMLSGNLAWSLACPRYHGPGGGWDWADGAPDRMVLYPDRTVFSSTVR